MISKENKLTEDEIEQLSIIALSSSRDMQFLIKLIERLANVTISPARRDW